MYRIPILFPNNKKSTYQTVFIEHFKEESVLLRIDLGETVNFW